MSIRISNDNKSVFVGEVFPVRLLGEELRYAPVTWSICGARAHIREFGREKGGFSDGVLVTPLEEGELTVTAELEGREYACRVSVRPMKHTESGRMNYYLADLHDHTTMIHNYEEYVRDGSASQRDYVAFQRTEGKLDLAVISDHADVIDEQAFFRGFTEAEASEGRPVILAGAESEITLIEKDRFGFPHKNSGEIVTLNADNFASVRSHAEFFERLSTSPYVVGILAHPQIIGFDSNGIWNFSLEKHREDGFDKYIKLVEMGNGSLRDSNIINEYVYSVALDNGFRVSTTCSSDQHEAPWGVGCFPGKTVIMAPDGSKESLLDALLSGRCYCSESGNVKLYCEVNGSPLPADLAPATEYKFRVELSYFRNVPETVPVSVEIVTDYGRVAAEAAVEGREVVELSVTEPDARWFYLRLRDGQGRKTLSPPAYTGRPYDPVLKAEPRYLDKQGMTATDLLSGTDASVLLNGNPNEHWSTDLGKADILIDMGRVEEVSALAHYPWRIFRWAGVEESMNFATLVADYEVSASLDGKHFATLAEGVIRTYGGETLIRFAPTRARYLRFTAKTNVGVTTRLAKFASLPLNLAELSPATL